MLFPYTFLFENINILHSCDNIDVTFYIEMSFIWKDNLQKIINKVDFLSP